MGIPRNPRPRTLFNEILTSTSPEKSNIVSPQGTTHQIQSLTTLLVLLPTLTRHSQLLRVCKTFPLDVVNVQQPQRRQLRFRSIIKSPVRYLGYVLYARYLCSRDALGLKAEPAGRPSAARDDRVSCIQGYVLRLNRGTRARTFSFFITKEKLPSFTLPEPDAHAHVYLKPFIHCVYFVFYVYYFFIQFFVCLHYFFRLLVYSVMYFLFSYNFGSSFPQLPP